MTTTKMLGSLNFSRAIENCIQIAQYTPVTVHGTYPCLSSKVVDTWCTVRKYPQRVALQGAFKLRCHKCIYYLD